ncbi:hypothetical protein BD324DRAFT_638833 [Kockovaella imperatae]|uniref:Zn(2)-C6 fungal-type domain-containing protein n=1 Tax=Kockovaella imperatae TaxID=4999 RepID=A0A1Y1U758_9TREE|nr:hypothetical protein BD324DRAFT_638833 [Kockovaella imperatae]ORX33842.1 hypothetical protein BD324DRAFT_638833 [Kockovaella imperatae]
MDQSAAAPQVAGSSSSSHIGLEQNAQTYFERLWNKRFSGPVPLDSSASLSSRWPQRESSGTSTAMSSHRRHLSTSSEGHHEYAGPAQGPTYPVTSGPSSTQAHQNTVPTASGSQWRCESASSSVFLRSLIFSAADWTDKRNGPQARPGSTECVPKPSSAVTSLRFSQLLDAKLAAEGPQSGTNGTGSMFYPPMNPTSQHSGTWSSARTPDASHSGLRNLQQSAWPLNAPTDPSQGINQKPTASSHHMAPTQHLARDAMQSLAYHAQSPVHIAETTPHPPQSIGTPPTWPQMFEHSPYMQMVNASENKGRPIGPLSQQASAEMPPYMQWGTGADPNWSMAANGVPRPWQNDQSGDLSQNPTPAPVPMASLAPTPTLTHKTSSSIDSLDRAPMTPPVLFPLQGNEHMYPSADPAPMGYPMHTASDVPSNGDIGAGYIGVGQNRNGSGSGSGANGDGDMPSGFGNDQGDDHGDNGENNGGGGGSGGDGQDGENGGPPTSRKRVKLPLACHFCRRRKLKCDGKRPECDNCLKRGEECIYDDHVRRRGPGKRTKEMRDKAAREAVEAGMTNPNSAGGNGIAGPSDLDAGDFSGVLEEGHSLAVDGIDGLGHHHEYDGGDGAVMEAMDAVMGAGINLDMGSDEGALHHMARVGIEGIEGMADHSNSSDFLGSGLTGIGVGGGNGQSAGAGATVGGEPSTLAELSIDPSLRGIGVEGKGKKRKLENETTGFEEVTAKLDRS